MQKLIYSVLIFSLFIACNNKNSQVTKNTIQVEENIELTTAEKIANHYGFQNWKTISEINYTFNVKRGEKTSFRSWVWNPKTGNVKMITAKDIIQYNRKSIDSLSQNTDKAFINDKFWLLAPFNLVTDSGVTFTEKQQVIAPISGDTLNLLTAVYGNEGGYTPGDAYDLYFDKSYTIKEWSFRKGNQKEVNFSTTWENEETFSNITLSKTRKDSIGFFSIYFTDISVKN